MIVPKVVNSRADRAAEGREADRVEGGKLLLPFTKKAATRPNDPPGVVVRNVVDARISLGALPIPQTILVPPASRLPSRCDHFAGTNTPAADVPECPSDQEAR